MLIHKLFFFLNITVTTTNNEITSYYYKVFNKLFICSLLKFTVMLWYFTIGADNLRPQ